MPEGSGGTIEQDIAQLERQLQEKKALLEHPSESGQASSQIETSPSSEKEILRSVVGEKITQHAPQYQITSPASSSGSQKDEPSSYLDPALKDKVQQLVNIVFGTNLEDGIKAAVRENNPALMDAFHDILVDQLYNALIERRKLQKLD